MTFVNESPLVIYLANMHTSEFSFVRKEHGAHDNVKLIEFDYFQGNWLIQTLLTDGVSPSAGFHCVRVELERKFISFCGFV